MIGVRTSVLGCGWMMLVACRSSAPPEGAPLVAVEALEPEIVPATAVPLEPDVTHRVRDLEITVLSTKLAPRGVGEWGFAALVEADGQRILFDTGARRDTVLRNAETLGIDLGSVPLVVLSHHHGDHVGGLLALRRELAERDPTALATVHVARGIFEPRRNGTRPRQVNGMLSIRPAFEASGGRIVVHEGPAEIAPGVWVTGPVAHCTGREAVRSFRELASLSAERSRELGVGERFVLGESPQP